MPGALFAEKLIEKMPGLSRVYYCNSGSEANEKAFKMVRQIAHKKYGGKKYKVLYRDRDYHGTTIAALSAGGQDERNAQYGPFTPGFVRVPHCLEYRAQWDLSGEEYGKRAADAIEEVILSEGPDTVGGLCLEPVTAGGGVITPPEGYWDRVQEICQKYDILLHIDEVVCGLGRTGTWFGYQNYGIKPDMVTMAKGVASGYAAIACLVTTEEVFDSFKDNPDDKMNYFRDISTFGGCTAGPTAAIENMRIIEDENLLENTVKMGARMMDNLDNLAEKHPVVGDVRGSGLFCGAELVKDRKTKEPEDEKSVQAVVADCAAQGVLIGATNRSLPGLNNTLCFSPALIATPDDIDQMAERHLERVLVDVRAARGHVREDHRQAQLEEAVACDRARREHHRRAQRRVKSAVCRFPIKKACVGFEACVRFRKVGSSFGETGERDQRGRGAGGVGPGASQMQTFALTDYYVLGETA